MQAFPSAAFLGTLFFILIHFFGTFQCTENILDDIYIMNSGLPSDLGSNIGSYSVAVAGMHPIREVNFKLCILPQFNSFSHLLSKSTVHCAVFQFPLSWSHLVLFFV